MILTESCNAQDAVYFAYFAPFSFEAHQDLIARTQCDSRVTLELLGETLDGHDIDLLKIGAIYSHHLCALQAL